MELESELFINAELGDGRIEVHLVSWDTPQADDTQTASERYGIYIGTENGGTLVATFEDGVPYEVCVSTLLASNWGNVTNGSDRAAGVVQSMNSQPESDLIIPDTATVEQITK